MHRSGPPLLYGAMFAAVGCISSTAERTIASAEASVRAGSPYLAASSLGPRSTRAGTPAVRAPTRSPPDDAALARPIELQTAEVAALSRHPALTERTQRVRALVEQARSEGHLPPPMLMVDLAQVPLSRPYAIPDAQMLSVSLTQEFPPAGSLDLMASATALEARAAAAMVAAEARMLLREVDRTFAEYVQVHSELAAHRQHRAIVVEMEAVARARSVARGSFGDAARAALERVKLDAQIEGDVSRVAQARAMLNGLMARSVSAPLGPPIAGEPLTVELPPEKAAERAEVLSPEVAAAEAMRQAAHGVARARDREDSVPTFVAGVSYFHPVGEMAVAGWGAQMGMNLPWLWGGASNRTASAEHRSLGEAAAASRARLRVRSEAARSVAAVRGAAARFCVLRDAGRPAAARALSITSGGYAAGASDILMWLDAARTALDIELELAAARAELDRALADLDAVVGERVPRVSLPSADSAASPILTSPPTATP